MDLSRRNPFLKLLIKTQIVKVELIKSVCYIDMPKDDSFKYKKLRNGRNTSYWPSALLLDELW